MIQYQDNIASDHRTSNEGGAVGGMRNCRGNRSTRRNPSLCPQIPYDLSWDRTQAAGWEAGDQPATLWHGHYVDVRRYNAETSDFHSVLTRLSTRSFTTSAPREELRFHRIEGLDLAHVGTGRETDALEQGAQLQCPQRVDDTFSNVSERSFDP
jgi:hypothetical protein